MRIAIAYDCLFPFSVGGGERQYRVFAEEFAAAGHQITYLTRRQWDGPAPELEGIRVVTVSEDREIYDAHGARTVGPAVRFAYGLAVHLRRHHRDYDAVLVSATPATNVPAARAALVGTRVVLAVDWLEVFRPEQWRAYSGRVVGRVAGLVQRLAICCGPLASCHSALVASRLRAAGLRRDPLVSPGLIPDGPFGEPELEPAAPPTVVYVGRHIPDKRVETLPAAISAARAELPGLTATIFGDGPSHSAVKAEIDRLDLRDVVRLPGFVSQDELEGGVRTANCLVNPSAREGYGLVVVEAAAFGTPVVLVEGGDNASLELVAEGVNGTIARSCDPAELGAAIVRAVRGDVSLRRATRGWFELVSRTQTIRAAAAALVARLEAEVDGRTRRSAAP
ncbi:glycosyltransferase family 4 protein [Pseudonocardia kujensis]|uniref:glycosyltransferase family 4 protein n=1 Tax=Pseudonocardia kujensis TaxID=1128675 RepID=UPI001E456F75|nr:glycosyltransferase family 4 protein [Pseudonocardia kujensis]MCE0761789.1 glycosyltransferase family 4 protein [Pseudonocardia kujensis]